MKKIVTGLLIAQTAFMYIGGGALFLWSMLKVGSSVAFLICAVAFSAVGTVFVVTSGVLSALCLGTGEPFSLRTALIFKLIHIPYYIANFVFWFFVLAALFNPFMILAVPVVIGIAAFSAYCFLLSSSLPGVFAVVGMLKRREIKASPALTAALIFHFFFVFDVLGAIMARALAAKARKAETEEIPFV